MNEKTSVERFKQFMSEANITPYTDAESLAESAWQSQEYFYKNLLSELYETLRKIASEEYEDDVVEIANKALNAMKSEAERK